MLAAGDVVRGHLTSAFLDSFAHRPCAIRRSHHSYIEPAVRCASVHNSPGRNPSAKLPDHAVNLESIEHHPSERDLRTKFYPTVPKISTASISPQRLSRTTPNTVRLHRCRARATANAQLYRVFSKPVFRDRVCVQLTHHDGVVYFSALISLNI